MLRPLSWRPVQGVDPPHRSWLATHVGALLVTVATLCAAPACAQSFGIPDPRPAAVERRDVRLSADESRRYLTDWRRAARPTFAAPLLRWSFGGEAYFDDAQTLGGSFAFDVEGGYRFVLEPGRRSGFCVVPIAGYGFSAGDVTSHLVSAGLGLGHEGRSYSLVYYGRAVLGAVGSASTVGVRHGLVAEVGNILGVSIAHEILQPEDRSGPIHGVRIAATIDLSPFFYGVEDYFDE